MVEVVDELLRPHGVAEEGAVAAGLEPVAAGLLPLRPAGGEVLDPRDLVVDDGAVAEPRPDEPVARGAEEPEEIREALEGERGSIAGQKWLIRSLGGKRWRSSISKEPRSGGNIAGPAQGSIGCSSCEVNDPPSAEEISPEAQL
jgi:hypothetical protein